MSKKRNNAIDITRYILAAIFIIVHIQKFINPEAPTTIASYFIRIGLPFFFCTSGYFFISSTIKGKKKFLTQLKQILLLYTAWTLIYYIASFVENILIGKENIGEFLMDRVLYYMFDGSYYHLWYVPALIYSMLAVAIVYKVFGEKGIKGLTYCSLVLYIIGVMGSSYYNLGVQVPVLRNIYESAYFPIIRNIFFMGFPYFTMGYIIYILKNRIEKTSRKKTNIVTGIIALLCIAEILILTLILDWRERPEMFFGIYPLLLIIYAQVINKPIYKYNKIGAHLRIQANFIYFVHPLIMIFIKIIFDLINLHLSVVTLYILTVIISFVTAFIMQSLNFRIFNIFLGVKNEKKQS